MYSQWYSETWATTAVQALHLHVDPATGENGLFGEFLINAQGEDVVAGVTNT